MYFPARRKIPTERGEGKKERQPIRLPEALAKGRQNRPPFGNALNTAATFLLPSGKQVS